MLKIQKFVVNPIQENAYVVSDQTGECVFIDPGFYDSQEKKAVKDYISINELKPVMIINTHCHFDHIMGVEFIRKEYNIPFYIHPDDKLWIQNAVSQALMFGIKINKINPPDNFFYDGDMLKFGNTDLKVIHIPGHSSGHVVFYFEEEKIIFGGDVLFSGSIGRTDFPGGNHQNLVFNIKNKLLVFPEETIVYTGHGPETTVGREKCCNPFLE